MKKTKIFYMLGVILIAASLIILLMHKRALSIKSVLIQNTTQLIQESLPPRTQAVENQYTNIDMPVINILGKDYCALLEVPFASVVLPVANVWNSAEITPERYSGSVYDGSMIIGGNGEEYQLGFVSQLDFGNRITVVDMYGGQFNYTVQSIDRAKYLSKESLLSEEYRLTLFAYIAKEEKYIVVRCK